MPFKRQAKRTKRVTDPQTGTIMELLHTDRELTRKIAGHRARWWGEKGEEFVSNLFPDWTRSKSGQQGFDFLRSFRNGFKRVEVKTLDAENLVKGDVLLSVRSAKWQNKLADEILFVTLEGIYKGDANRLRQYVKRVLRHPHMKRVRDISNNTIVRLNFNLDRMIATGVVRPQNINHRHFRRFIKGEMRKARENR